MIDLELLELLPLAKEFEMEKPQLKSAERQIRDYVNRFDSTAEFPAKSDVEIQLAYGFVTIEHSVKSGTVFVDRLYTDEDVNLTVTQRTHLKYQFVEEMEKRYRDLTDYDEINRDYFIEEKIDRKLYK